MQIWLGVDLGTSALKATAINQDGQVIARATAGYETHRPNAGWVEQDPLDWLSALSKVLTELDIDLTKVAGVGIVGQTPTLVVTDSLGNPLRPAMTWQDTRSQNEADLFAAEIPDVSKDFGLSLPWAPSGILPKVRWLKAHEPKILEKGSRLLQAKDFLLFHLTGEFASDNWSSKGLINAQTLKPTQAWNSLALPNELIPAIGKPWEVAGKTSVNNKFLPSGIPVAIGWSDALAGMLALEVFSKPTAFVISGSSDIAGISCTKLPEGRHNLSTVPESCAPIPVIFGPTQSSGSAISWAAELFNSTPEELLSKSLERSEVHSEIFLPFLAGERAPIWRSDIRALFAGLSHQSKFSDIAHAVIFGVGFTARHIIDQAKSLSKELPSVVHLGGASHQSKLWLDIRSRILHSEVISFSESDSSSIGAAILAASAATGISPEALAPKFSGEKLHFTSTVEDQNIAYKEYEKYLDWVERSIR